MIRLLVSGTNTEVGKTWFSGFLARHFREQDMAVRYVKPVQTGCPPDDDAALVREISGLSEAEAFIVNTAAEPVAPCFLYDPFPFEETVAVINEITDCDVLIVESAGGLLVPLDKERKSYHFARACDLDVALVVPNRLGCLNDTQLNLRFIASEGLPLHGVAINDFFASDGINRERNKAMLNTLYPDCIRYVFGSGGLSSIAE